MRGGQSRVINGSFLVLIGYRFSGHGFSGLQTKLSGLHRMINGVLLPCAKPFMMGGSVPMLSLMACMSGGMSVTTACMIVSMRSNMDNGMSAGMGMPAALDDR